MKPVVIHVAQDAIRRNSKNGTNEPAIIVRRGQKATRHNEVEIRLHDGQLVGKFVYQPHSPLSCGARLWLSIDSDIAEVSHG